MTSQAPNAVPQPSLGEQVIDWCGRFEAQQGKLAHGAAILCNAAGDSWHALAVTANQSRAAAQRIAKDMAIVMRYRGDESIAAVDNDDVAVTFLRKLGDEYEDEAGHLMREVLRLKGIH